MTITQIQTAIDTDITSKVAPNTITPENVGEHLAEQAAHSMTRAALLTAIAGNELIPGALYEISDRGDRGLYFYAVKDNELSQTGWRRMLCPARYSSNEDLGGNEWRGVWSPTKLVLAGNLMIWGGKVWENLTGAIGTATSFYELDAVNWVLITKTGFANAEYVEMIFECQYDLSNDHIAFQWDAKGNKVGCTFAFLSNVDGGAHLNYCDETDWNMNANDDGYMFENNQAMLIGNNAWGGHIIGNRCPNGLIANNRNGGTISYNVCMGLGNAIFDNSNTSDIADNICDLLNGNSNNGVISGNRAYSIDQNSNGAAINGNVCSGTISNNSNSGAISDNRVIAITTNGSAVNAISLNENNGTIEDNTCTGAISQNRNNGNIEDNSNDGSIERNVNNGRIFSCSGVSSILDNFNNGSITGAHGADVTDTVTNKT